jgi:hypothetical protein
MQNRNERLASMTTKTVEVYLASCSIRGTIETPHARVSDHLGSPDEVLRVREARVVLRDGSQVANNRTALVNKAEILFVVDLTTNPSGHLGFQVERAPLEVTLNVGNIWLKGQIHLPIGGDINSFFTGAVNRFMAITEATVVGYEQGRPRTVIINRDQLNCMLTE